MERAAQWNARRWAPHPEAVHAELFATLPADFRKERVTAWSIANAGGRQLACFLEGPAFDVDGSLLVVDIPNGRVFRVDARARWTLVAEYDGWPNGLAFDRAGVLHVADHRLGILTLDPLSGRTESRLEGHRGERFRGVNDLLFAANGDLYFTDQGQTGWQDPRGRVYRCEAGTERLSCLADFLPSPNGLALNAPETQLFVAVTRANAVWRLPMAADGGVSKVGTYIQMSGGAAGPDGLAIDRADGLVVAHPGTTVWRFDRWGMPSHVLGVGHDAFFTNVALAADVGHTDVYATDAMRGEIWRARLPAFGEQGRAGDTRGDAP